MELRDALRGTGAARQFTDDAVPDEVIHRILDTARFAPSGGNRQGWRVIVVKDPAIRTGIRDLYLPGWGEYLAQMQAGLTPFAPVTDAQAEAAAIERAHSSTPPHIGASSEFAAHIDEVPVLLVLLADLRVLAAVDKDLDRYTLVGGASIYPFAWSILLSARDEGLGGVITTMPIRREPELKALLSAPDELAVAGVIALGRPVHQPTRLKRGAVESFTTVDRSTGAAFTG